MPAWFAAELLIAIPQGDDLTQKIKTFRNNKRFTVKYDRFRDETRVKVGPFFVGGTSAYVTSGRQLELSAACLRSRVETTQTMYLLFESRSKDWTFLKSRELFVLADGERLSFGEGERDSDIRSDGVSEKVVFDIPIEAFDRISKVGKAELKVGPLELTLKDEHKEAFRDLLSLCK